MNPLFVVKITHWKKKKKLKPLRWDTFQLSSAGLLPWLHFATVAGSRMSISHKQTVGETKKIALHVKKIEIVQ